MKFLDQDNFLKPVNCKISAAVTRKAAAHQKTATGGSPAVGRGGFRGTSAGDAAAARLVQSRHARSGQPATPRPTYYRQTPTRTTPPRRRCNSSSRRASLACPAPHRPGRPSPAASPLSAPARPSLPEQWGRQMFRINNTAAPQGLEQLLSARPAPHSPAPPHPSVPAPPGPFRLAWTSQPPAVLHQPSGYGVAERPTKTECQQITKFSLPGLVAAGTRRCGAAWTYCKTIPAIHCKK